MEFPIWYMNIELNIKRDVLDQENEWYFYSQMTFEF